MAPVFHRSEATEVEIVFAADGDGTRVRLEQRGWERLGAAGAERRNRTEMAWGAITVIFRDAVIGA